jgi:hypothetical protein
MRYDIPYTATLHRFSRAKILYGFQLGKSVDENHHFKRPILPFIPARKTVCPFLAFRQTWNPDEEISRQFLPPSSDTSTPEVPQHMSLY